MGSLKLTVIIMRFPPSWKQKNKEYIMSVLVYIESDQGKFKKSALEVASYGKAVANQLESTVTLMMLLN